MVRRIKENLLPIRFLVLCCYVNIDDFFNDLLDNFLNWNFDCLFNDNLHSLINDLWFFDDFFNNFGWFFDYFFDYFFFNFVDGYFFDSLDVHGHFLFDNLLDHNCFVLCYNLGDEYWLFDNFLPLYDFLNNDLSLSISWTGNENRDGRSRSIGGFEFFVFLSQVFYFSQELFFFGTGCLLGFFPVARPEEKRIVFLFVFADGISGGADIYLQARFGPSIVLARRLYRLALDSFF